MATVNYVAASRVYAKDAPPAVDALDLDIQDGEFMVLVGPSGSGKTTALRMLAGLEPLDGGRIEIEGRDVTWVPPKDRDIAATGAGLTELVLGIRPEHLHLANGSGDLSGEIMLVEELGADALLHVRLAGDSSPVVARAEGRKPPAPGQRVTFHVQPEDIFAFHPVTGARLAG
jgi:ABC-type sugar transport system ATPase subunit